MTPCVESQGKATYQEVHLRDMCEVEGVGNNLLQVLVGVSKPQNVGGQTDAVSADRRGVIAPSCGRQRLLSGGDSLSGQSDIT